MIFQGNGFGTRRAGATATRSGRHDGRSAEVTGYHLPGRWCGGRRKDRGGSRLRGGKGVSRGHSGVNRVSGVATGRHTRHRFAAFARIYPICSGALGFSRVASVCCLHDREDFYPLGRIKVFAIMKYRPGKPPAGRAQSELSAVTTSGLAATPETHLNSGCLRPSTGSTAKPGSTTQIPARAPDTATGRGGRGHSGQRDARERYPAAMTLAQPIPRRPGLAT
jgi:hypothetical protein